jgi:ABC-type molybdenum transport system ATPase subunit/photorepair protein PhrA
MTIYIAIEGPDGAGKTTLANYLNNHKTEISSHFEVISHRNFETSSSGVVRFIGNITSSIANYGENHGIEGIANLGYALCELPYILAKGKYQLQFG